MIRGIMIRKLGILCLSILFCGSVALAADSKGNRKEQTARFGIKPGIHLMYLITSPFVLEIPGEEWTFGVVYGSGDLKSTSTSSTYSNGTWTTTSYEDVWTFTTTELTGRYYFGNSFNIPFGIAQYNIHDNNYEYSSTVTYELDYSITQLNVGVGNDWTFDWGGFIAADWVQGGAKLSEKASATLKSGTETSTTKAKAETTSTEQQAFAGAVIVTFGFGF
jgi:hypothetical protein